MKCYECNDRQIVDHNGDQVLCDECVDLMAVLQEAIHLRDYHRKGQLLASLQYCTTGQTRVSNPYMVVWNASTKYPYRKTVFCRTCEEADDYVMIEIYTEKQKRNQS